MDAPQEKRDGTAWGLYLHRRVDPARWPEALESVPAEHRAAAERYLRDIAARMRVARKARKEREEREAREAFHRRKR